MKNLQAQRQHMCTSQQTQLHAAPCFAILKRLNKVGALRARRGAGGGRAITLCAPQTISRYLQAP